MGNGHILVHSSVTLREINDRNQAILILTSSFLLLIVFFDEQRNALSHEAAQ